MKAQCRHARVQGHGPFHGHPQGDGCLLRGSLALRALGCSAMGVEVVARHHPGQLIVRQGLVVACRRQMPFARSRRDSVE